MDDSFNFDINLDFLDQPSISDANVPSNNLKEETSALPTNNQVNISFNAEELAMRISNVDTLVLQIKCLQEERSKIQKQLEEFNSSAKSIQNLYESEKLQRIKLEETEQTLQIRCNQLETDLINKTLECDQYCSQLADEKGPLAYNQLVLKFLRFAGQLDEEKLLSVRERQLTQELYEYVKSKGLSTLPLPKKKIRVSKQQRTDLLKSPKTLDKVPSVSRGTQYVSSTTTRGTSTSVFIKTQSIGTNFPETPSTVKKSLDDIFSEMISDKRPISPIKDLLTAAAFRKQTNSIGTITNLNNVRKPIDYVSINNTPIMMPQIKRSNSRPPSRNMYENIKNEAYWQTVNGSNPFIGTSMPDGCNGFNPFTAPLNSLPMYLPGMELWNLLGQTIFGWLQNQNRYPFEPNRDENGGQRMPSYNPQFESNTEVRNDEMRQERSNFENHENYYDGHTRSSHQKSCHHINKRNMATSPLQFPCDPEFTSDCSSFNLTHPLRSPKTVLYPSSSEETSELENEKLAVVNEILKLFPESQNNTEKRYIIQRLLKTTGQKKLNLQINKNVAGNREQIVTSVSMKPKSDNNKHKKSKTRNSSHDFLTKKFLKGSDLNVKQKRKLSKVLPDHEIEHPCKVLRGTKPKEIESVFKQPFQYQLNANDKCNSEDSTQSKTLFSNSYKTVEDYHGSHCTSPKRSILTTTDSLDVNTENNFIGLNTETKTELNYRINSSEKITNDNFERFKIQDEDSKNNMESPTDELHLLQKDDMYLEEKGSYGTLENEKPLVTSVITTVCPSVALGILMPTYRTTSSVENVSYNCDKGLPLLNEITEGFTYVNCLSEQNSCPQEDKEKHQLLEKVIINDHSNVFTNQTNEECSGPLVGEFDHKNKKSIITIEVKCNPSPDKTLIKEKQESVTGVTDQCPDKSLLGNKQDMVEEHKKHEEIDLHEDVEELNQCWQLTSKNWKHDYMCCSEKSPSKDMQELFKQQEDDFDLLSEEITTTTKQELFIHKGCCSQHEQLNITRDLFEQFKDKVGKCSEKTASDRKREILEVKTLEINLYSEQKLPEKKQVPDQSQNKFNKSLDSDSKEKSENEYKEESKVQKILNKIENQITSPEVGSQLERDAEDNMLNNKTLPSILSKTELSGLLELPLVLQSPKNDIPNDISFKTPERPIRNRISSTSATLLSDILTSSTENLVEDYLEENVADAIKDDKNRFQKFLCKMLDEIAPRISPISIIDPSEDGFTSMGENGNEGSSCDETKIVNNNCTKQSRKRIRCNTTPTKRSERIKAKKSAMESLSSYPRTMPYIEIGKYTKRKTDTETQQQNRTKKIKSKASVEMKTPEPSIPIYMGFFKERSEENTAAVEDNDIRKVNRFPTDHDYSKQLNDLNFSHFDRNCYSPAIESSLLNSNTNQFSATESGAHKSIAYRESPAASFKQNDELKNIYNSSPSLCNTKRNSDYFYSPASSECSYEINHQKYDFNSIADRQEHCCTDSPASPLDCNNLFNYASYESPASPPPEIKNYSEAVSMSNPKEIPLHSQLKSNASTLSRLIESYNCRHYKALTLSYLSAHKSSIVEKLRIEIKWCITQQENHIDYMNVVKKLRKLTPHEYFITKAITEELNSVCERNSELFTEVFLEKAQCIISELILHLKNLYPNIIVTLLLSIEKQLFTFTSLKKTIPSVINLTRLYMETIKRHIAITEKNPARLFICKCIYFYNKLSAPMIYETLCYFPTVLPHRENRAYDRSDALITTIQHIVMSNNYDMTNKELKHKELLSKLRYEYHFEPFKPRREELIENLIAKIRANKCKNVSYSFALLCKRIQQTQIEQVIIQQHLLPLANEYYLLSSQTSENDERISCVLETISIIIRAFSLETDVTIYTSIFVRFLNGVNRQLVQESALQALLRISRFGCVNSFNAIYNYSTIEDLQPLTRAMLRTFIYKQKLMILQKLEKQAVSNKK